MTTQTEKRRIPADIWDTLELSALANGGVGRGSYCDAYDVPCCIVGHAWGTGMYRSDEIRLRRITEARGLGLGVLNDEAVRIINERAGRDAYARVTFQEYVEEMGWERGD